MLVTDWYDMTVCRAGWLCLRVYRLREHSLTHLSVGPAGFDGAAGAANSPVPSGAAAVRCAARGRLTRGGGGGGEGPFFEAATSAGAVRADAAPAALRDAAALSAVLLLLPTTTWLPPSAAHGERAGPAVASSGARLE